MNLADKTDTVNRLTMNVGRTIMDSTRTTTLYSASADVETGNLGLGAITVATDFAENSFGPTDGNSLPATIGGTGKFMQAQGFIRENNAASGFTVNDTFVPSTNSDLNIQASISDFAPNAAGFLPGLREGTLSGNISTNQNPEQSYQFYPRMGEYGQTNANSGGLPWQANVTWVYTGEFFDADGVVTFAAKLNAQWQLIIDGYAVARAPTVGDNGL